MKTFTSLEQAFEWWLKTIYPTIPPSLKKGKYRNAWRDYTFKKGISQKRMRAVLSDFGNISEKVTVTFNLEQVICWKPAQISIFVSMTTFASMEEAFQWWLTNIYPSLPAEVKKGKLTYAWRDFTYKRGISQARMKEILSEYGEIEVQTLIKYSPK